MRFLYFKNICIYIYNYYFILFQKYISKILLVLFAKLLFKYLNNNFANKTNKIFDIYFEILVKEDYEYYSILNWTFKPSSYTINTNLGLDYIDKKFYKNLYKTFYIENTYLISEDKINNYHFYIKKNKENLLIYKYPFFFFNKLIFFTKIKTDNKRNYKLTSNLDLTLLTSIPYNLYNLKTFFITKSSISSHYYSRFCLGELNLEFNLDLNFFYLIPFLYKYDIYNLYKLDTIFYSQIIQFKIPSFIKCTSSYFINEEKDIKLYKLESTNNINDLFFNFIENQSQINLKHSYKYNKLLYKYPL